jgi:hypothetical protein
MTREQLAHVLRAAARIVSDPNILVIGSQAILGSYREDELPEVAWLSVEADLAFFDGEGGTRKADEVDGKIGELSQFHETFSYYAQGVDLGTAKLPDGWEQRLVPFEPPSAEPARARCLEKHDLVISKLVAMRQKDREFADALLRANLVNMGILRDRAAALTSVSPVVRKQVLDWLESAQRRRRTHT